MTRADHASTPQSDRQPRKGEPGVKLLYFAWVRERVGRGEETIDLPAHVGTIGDLIAWLKTRGPEFEAAFAKSDLIRTAIDQTHVKHDHDLRGAREIAFFPPVTGG